MMGARPATCSVGRTPVDFRAWPVAKPRRRALGAPVPGSSPQVIGAAHGTGRTATPAYGRTSRPVAPGTPAGANGIVLVIIVAPPLRGGRRPAGRSEFWTPAVFPRAQED